VRIVGGKYKGKRFVPPKNFPSRPTTDFAKEALFNILENRFDFEDLTVLDLFSGTGSIGMEFLSRGAKTVLSVDNHPVSMRHLKNSKEKLLDNNWQILKSDAVSFLKSTKQKFNLIFADPPFDLKNKEDLITLIFEKKLLHPEGTLIIEHGRENNFENKTQFVEIRNYGGVHFSFFE